MMLMSLFNLPGVLMYVAKDRGNHVLACFSKSCFVSFALLKHLKDFCSAYKSVSQIIAAPTPPVIMNRFPRQ